MREKREKEVMENNFKERLVRLTEKLNTNFILFMSNIKCKGKVQLENVDIFRNIGLDVQVSFRNDQELQSLNGQVQSGGVGFVFFNLPLGKIAVNHSISPCLAGNGLVSFPCD